MIRMLGALGLFGLSLTTGCVTEDDASGTYPVDGLNGQAMGKSLPPGASIEDCLIVTGDTGWDTASFGGTEAWCLNRDEDEAFDVDSSDPFADGCICLIAGTLPSEYVQVDETTVLIEDCDDEDAAVTGADVTAYTDADSDGYGDDASATLVCGLDSGMSTTGGDCDDGDSSINPLGTETCNDVDDNCDGEVDDADDDLVGGNVYYEDGDGDGFGDADDGVIACEQPENFVEDATDCDDGDSGINPGATEIADDGIDQDCDGVDTITASSDDADGDGFDSIDAGGTDCDDGDGDINPDATEVSLDGVDNNCDGAANTDDLIEVCGDPVDALLAYTWQLWLRPEDEASWDVVAEGTDELCAEVYIEDGVSQYVQGPFDRDGDGIFDEDYVDATTGDGIWLYQDDGTVHTNGLTANGVTISMTTYDWGDGTDGLWIVDLQ